MPIEMVRIMGLDTAADMLGKGALADDLGISVRALNFKINAERGICDSDVIATVRALEDRAQKLLTHAAKLRATISAGQG